MKFTLKFWTGIILLLTNQPLGWGAILICNGIAINNDDAFFSLVGICIYAFSWLMLGVGFLLSGNEGIKYSSNLLKKAWRSLVNKRTP